MTARLGLAYMGVRHAFTTRNVHVPGRVGGGGTGRRAVLAARRHLAVPPAGPTRQRGRGLQDRVRPALCLRQPGAGSGGQPGVRPRRQHLRRLLRATCRAGLWRALTLRSKWSTARGRGRSTCVALDLPDGATAGRCVAGQRPAASGMAWMRPASTWASGARPAESTSHCATATGCEVYRPLSVDPKEARRLRYRKRGKAGAAISDKSGDKLSGSPT